MTPKQSPTSELRPTKRRGRSPLNQYAPQILIWIRDDKTQEWIAKKLIDEYQVPTTQRSVSRLYKRLKASSKSDEAIQKAKETYAIDLAKAMDLLDELIRDVVTIQKMGLEERNAFRSKLEAVREGVYL